MLSSKYALFQRLRCVAWSDWHFGAAKDSACIQLLSHEMDRAATHGIAGGKRAGVGVEALVFREE